jgi:2-keto-3-deoxy-L-arabinonate dehydratase
MKDLRGIIPIVLTTFNDDGSLDLKSQCQLVKHLMSQGVHGLALFGNASEGYTLTGEERDELLRVIVCEVKGEVPIVVSTGHSGTYAAVQLSRTAENAGADALMVLPPHYMKPEGQDLYDYFCEISSAVSIPVMVQDAPMMSGVPMPAPFLARLGRDAGNVKYVKVEAPPTAIKVTDLVQQCNGDLRAFGGLNGNFLLEELSRGTVGCMPGSDMCAEFVEIWKAYERSDRAAAWDKFRRLLPMIRYELQPGLGVSVMKLNLQARGIIASARVRSPTRNLDRPGVREVQELRSEVWREMT